MRTPLLTLLAASLLLAGCTGSTKQAAPEPVVHPLSGVANATVDEATGIVTFGYDQSGCDEAVLVVPVDFAHAQRFLPANWTPADIQGLLGTPAPAGKAGAWLNAYTCRQGERTVQGAEIGFLVQAPVLAGANANASKDAALHLYQLAQSTDDAAFAAVLEHAGMANLRGNVTITPGMLPLPRYAFASANASHAFTPFAFASERMTTSANFWHQGNGSLSFLHFQLQDIEFRAGTAVDCAFAGLSAEVAGGQDCRGGAVVLVAPAQAWTATYHVLPGTYAAASA